MLLRHDQDHLFPGDGNIVEVGPLAVVADEDGVQLLVFQQLVQRGAGVLGEDEIQVRVSLDKGRDDIMKKKLGAAVRDADADDAFIVLAQQPDTVIQLPVQRKDLLGFLDAAAPGLGENHLLAHPVKQRCAVLSLDFFQELGQCRLRKIKPGRRLGKAFLPCDLDQIFKIFGVHFNSLLLKNIIYYF